MKLTKFVHSCVLIEYEGKAVLFDPGIFSWNSGIIDVATLPELDAVVVSHKHPDHCGEPFARALIARFPNVQWFAPEDAHEDLRSWGVQNITNQPIDDVQVSEQEHASLGVLAQAVVNNLVTHYADTVTHPGDTHDFGDTKEVLLLPMQAPWGLTVRAAELAVELKPKYVMPIHDWMWNDEWRQMMYDRFEALLKDTNTVFLRPVDGQPIEIGL